MTQKLLLTRLIKIFFLTTFIALGLSLVSNTPAHAGWGGGSGGGISSGGSCSRDAWTVVDDLDKVRGGGCSGTTDAYLVSKGGGECLAHENELIAVFYLQGHGTNGIKMWMGTTDGGSWNSPSIIKGQINTLVNNHKSLFGEYNNPDDLETLKKVAGNQATSAATTIICVWPGLLPTRVPIVKPDLTCVKGQLAITVPKAIAKKSQYYKYTAGNSQKALGDGKTYIIGSAAIGKSNGEFSIKQRLTPGSKKNVTWANPAHTKNDQEWTEKDYSRIPTCVVNVAIKQYQCSANVNKNIKNSGFFKTSFIGPKSQIVFQYKQKGGSWTDVSAGTSRTFKDGMTVSFRVKKLASGWKSTVTINDVLYKKASKWTITFEACANEDKSDRYWEYRTIYTGDQCVNGTYGGDVVDSMTMGPYEYAWVTVIQDGNHPQEFNDSGNITDDSNNMRQGYLDTQIATQLTPLGELLRKSKENGTSLTPALIEAAVAKGKLVKHATLDLSADNQEQIAKGAVMNVLERTTMVTLAIDKVEGVTYTFTDCTPQYDLQERYRDVRYETTAAGKKLWYCGPGGSGTPGTYGPKKKKPSANACWSSWETYDNDEGATVRSINNGVFNSNAYSVNDDLQATETTGFWQALANHCNADGYNEAVQSSEAITPIANNDLQKHWAGSAVTRVQNSDYTSTWGYGAVNGASTDKAGFFDKVCAYNGVKASAGAQPNEGDYAPNWTYFRDNAKNTIETYLYKPRRESVVNYANEDATRTMVTRWNLGTPFPWGTQAGEFTVTTLDNQDVWTNADLPAPTLTNWGYSETGSADVWSLLGGEQVAFNTQGDWASENGQPNVFEIKWEYNPEVTNTVPLKNIGFGPGSSQIYTPGVASTRVQGFVYGQAVGDSSPAEFDEFAANSGTGTVNNLDAKLHKGTDLNNEDKWVTDPNNFSPYYYWIKYVRAVGE